MMESEISRRFGRRTWGRLWILRPAAYGGCRRSGEVGLRMTSSAKALWIREMREGFAPAGPRHRRAREDADGARRALARRGLGAVGNGRFVAYGARSPARSAAEGHAQIFRRFPPAR